MVCFHTLISLLKLHVSVTGEQFKLHTVVNALGSFVDMYQVPSLNNFWLVWELEQLTLAY